MVISMVDVGEETGQLPDMLLKIADVYDEEVDNAVGAMTSMLEPIMIVFLAVVVGGIVFAMFLPLLQVIEKMEMCIRDRAAIAKAIQMIQDHTTSNVCTFAQ